MDLLKLEKKTIKAVKKAAKLFNHNHIDITEKGGASNIVTTADINIQHFLQKELKKIIKDSGFLGEEESLSEIDSDYYWIIDPIDGTANFSRLISECVISVALMHKNEPIVAVVYAPWKNLLWSARKDCGAYLNGERIHSSDRDFSHSLFCTSLTPYDKSLAKVCSDIILEAYPLCNDIRRFGACAIELCYLATGKCDLYFEARVCPWDYAAAVLIVKEADGFIGNFDDTISFDKTTMVKAANTKENFEKLDSIIKNHIKEPINFEE